MNEFLIKLRSISRNKKITLIFIVDLFLSFGCWIIFGPPVSVILAANFDVRLWEIILINNLNFIIPFLITGIYFYVSGLYRSSIRYSDSRDLTIRLIIGSSIFGILWGFIYLIQFEIIRDQFFSIVILRSMFLAFVFYSSVQFTRDLARLMIYPQNIKSKGKPVLIYGAGAAGNELYQSIKNNSDLNIVGFYDNSNALNGSEINNIKIFGKESDIKKLKKKYKKLEIYLAIPSLSISERRKIISSLDKFKVAVRSMPALHEIVADQKKMIEMQELSIEEILPRSIIKNLTISMSNLTIMITGAGGSIGSELVRQILDGNPKKIVLFEISEINLYEIESEINAIKKTKNLECEIIGILGDVKDKNRLENILNTHNVDYLYHAAAYKHVPIIEYHENITEGIKNNIFGTKSVCEAALNCKVKKVVVVSTDKAVRPTNIMGASKRFAEIIVQGFDRNSQSTKFCMVRFGNVINSSGSVIPLFRKQISNGGPLTITDKRVTRFFMTISEASNLVIQAGEFAKGGDVFILDMGEQIKIIDLAEKLIYLSGRNISYDNDGEGVEIIEIGLRPGEKLYEELLISGKEEITPNKKIFRSNENFPSDKIIKNAIEEIENGVLNNNTILIKEILKKYVEGFDEKDN